MTGLDTRPIQRETRATDPIKRRKVLIVRLEVGGRLLRIKCKGERRWLTLSWEDVYRAAFRGAALQGRRDRAEAKAAKKAGRACR